MSITVNQVILKITKECADISDSSYLDALVLISHHIKKPKEWLLSHTDATISQSVQKELETSIEQYSDGRPLPYIIGHWEFYGSDFLVNEHVLIPRPETEQLVEEAIGWMKNSPQSQKVADVGTGSGCIGISIARHISSAQVLATDISKGALRLAQENAKRLGVTDQILFVQQNLLTARDIDILCANLPYIPTIDLYHLPVSKFEPIIALNGGVSGLKYITSLLSKATIMVSRRALILLEIEEHQASDVKAISGSYFPYARVSILKDIAGKDRIVRVELV